ncbi:MAG TPA: LuxR C-terminal-related transcriptional regulator [Thermomicrobiales bacterium]|nr:LuxR C-terminal-related transcriptional regulator [Thermomicrobiales bacterium]
MPTLSRTQQEARIQIRQLAKRGLPPDALGRQFLTTIDTIVPSDGQRLFGVDPASLLFNRLIAASASDDTVRSGYLRDVYLHGGPLAPLDVPAVMRARLPAVAFAPRPELSVGIPAKLLQLIGPDAYRRAYAELGSPRGGVLRAGFASGSRWVAAMDLYRRDRRRPFQPSDVTFLRAVAPIIGQSIDTALQRERACNRTSSDHPDIPGVIILGDDLRVRFSSPAGEHWHARIAEFERGCRDPLPTAISSAVARLRHDSGSSVTGAVLMSTQDTLLRIEATPGGEDGSVVVIVTPQRPPPVPDIPANWPLSPREREIVRLLVQGAGNREIANRLFVSENTVETHLRHIFDKLNVANRSRLIARFFQTIYWPAIAESGHDDCFSVEC